MTERRLLLGLLALLAALLAFAIGLELTAIGDAEVPRPEALEGPVRFETENEARFWKWLVQCDADLRVAERRLEGEREKVSTASVTCSLVCAPAPTCPDCECATSVWTTVGVGAGALVGGVLIGSRMQQCPTSVVVTP